MLQLQPVACARCGAPFTATRATRRYCSRTCAARARYAHADGDAGRFWSHVDTTAGSDACWPCRLSTDRAGHAIAFWQGRAVGAHRVSWELAHGPVPPGRCVLQDCPGGANPRCVNPAHLFLGERPRRSNPPRGAAHAGAKLTAAAVREIRASPPPGATHAALARRFGVSRRTVLRVLAGHTWKHVA